MIGSLGLLSPPCFPCPAPYYPFVSGFDKMNFGPMVVLYMLFPSSSFTRAVPKVCLMGTCSFDVPSHRTALLWLPDPRVALGHHNWLQHHSDSVVEGLLSRTPGQSRTVRIIFEFLECWHELENKGRVLIRWLRNSFQTGTRAYQVLSDHP